MTRTISAVLLAVLAIVLTGCSSAKYTSNTNNAASIPNIAGPWEFRLVSSGGTQTGMEVALQEGKVLTNGAYQPDGNISASGTQAAFVTFDTSTGFVNGFGGYCSAGSSSTNSLSGAITALGGAVSNFTFTENGSVFSSTDATLSGDGQSMYGTYKSVTPTTCPDSGTFTAKVVPKLSGTYTGSLTLPSCPVNVTGCDSVSATLSEGASGSANLTFVLQGTDQGSLTLMGSVTGNAFSVQGTFQGQTVIFYGYYELTYNALDQQNDLPTLYLVNAASPAQPAGILTVPQT